jgi:hypothetical protein
MMAGGCQYAGIDKWGRGGRFCPDIEFPGTGINGLTPRRPGAKARDFPFLRFSLAPWPLCALALNSSPVFVLNQDRVSSFYETGGQFHPGKSHSITLVRHKTKVFCDKTTLSCDKITLSCAGTTLFCRKHFMA